MDRCKCWGITRVVITVEHCPSAASELQREMDRVVHFTMKETELQRFGKVTMGVAQFTPTNEG